MRICEIPGCGRHIRTGRKYCWEHRHTSQAEGVHGEQLVDKATKEFYDRRLFRSNMILVLIFLISIFISLVTNSFEICFLAFFVSFFILFLIAYKFFGYRSKTMIKKMIKNRDPEYVEWVQDKVQKDKEEREFKRSFFK